MNNENTSKVLVVEDREAELHNLAGGLAAAKAGADSEQLVEIEKLERQVKRAMGVRRLKPQLAVGQVVTIGTEFGECEEQILKVKASGCLRVTRKDKDAAPAIAGQVGEIVQIQARVGEQDVLTDYMITSLGRAWIGLRLMSPAEIEVRKHNAQPHVVIQRLAESMAAAGNASIEYTIALTKVNEKLEAMGKPKGPSASQLARRARKANRQQGEVARKTWRKYRANAVRELMGDAAAAGAFGLPEHAEAA